MRFTLCESVRVLSLRFDGLLQMRVFTTCRSTGWSCAYVYSFSPPLKLSSFNRGSREKVGRVRQVESWLDLSVWESDCGLR